MLCLYLFFAAKNSAKRKKAQTYVFLLLSMTHYVEKFFGNLKFINNLKNIFAIVSETYWNGDFLLL